MKLFKCQHCEQLLYFENTVCEKCGHRLGFIPDIMTLSALEPRGDVWRALAVDKNTTASAPMPVRRLNWMIEADTAESRLRGLPSQPRHSRTSNEDNLVAWRKIEVAEHRLFNTLMKLGLLLDSATRMAPSAWCSISWRARRIPTTAGDDR